MCVLFGHRTMRILTCTEDAVTRSCDERIPQTHSIVFQMRVHFHMHVKALKMRLFGLD